MLASFFHRTDGIGLSAPQVGINVQLMVFNPIGERGEGEEIVLVNPRINRYSRKIVPFNEGCLSFPGIHGDVEVPFTVTDFHIFTGFSLMSVVLKNFILLLLLLLSFWVIRFFSLLFLHPAKLALSSMR